MIIGILAIGLWLGYLAGRFEREQTDAFVAAIEIVQETSERERRRDRKALEKEIQDLRFKLTKLPPIRK